MNTNTLPISCRSGSGCRRQSPGRSHRRAGHIQDRTRHAGQGAGHAPHRARHPQNRTRSSQGRGRPTGEADRQGRQAPSGRWRRRQETDGWRMAGRGTKERQV